MLRVDRLQKPGEAAVTLVRWQALQRWCTDREALQATSAPTRLAIDFRQQYKPTTLPLSSISAEEGDPVGQLELWSTEALQHKLP